MIGMGKKIVGLAMAIVLALSAVIAQPGPAHANELAAAATANAPEIRLLEVTDSGASDLGKLAGYGSPAIRVDTVRMKQFVALRDELDGKYDAIYIGKGKYNATLVGTNQNHNTTDLMNDITALKAKQIKEGYIDRGLPVIAYAQKGAAGPLSQTKAGILQSFFSPYVASSSGNVPTSNKENVIFVGDDELTTAQKFLDKTKLQARATQRPRLVVTSEPTDYTNDPGKWFVAGDTLTYRFDVANVADWSQRRLVANLYMGIDAVLKFGADQLVVTQPVASPTGNTLTFRLPKGYSGVHYWKLELVDQNSTLRDIDTGVLLFRDQVTKISVLQVLPNNGDASSLKKSGNMNQSYLSSADYQISITTMGIDAFNSTGYRELNGKYDMLIFGFVDEYNRLAPINATAAAAVNAFIKTGQSVMFTHDTVYQGDSNWIGYFQQATGQVDPKTNMGLNAKEPSTTTKKVNEGLLTRFPFDISKLTTKVNTTHDQYFGLKLEDENLIPWYNITGGTRDSDDSWNHYYTYSYGNVTYSGTGHTNTNFPDWEQKLFVNTMYRAFIGSNHAPILTLSAPTDTATTNKIIPSYNDVLVSYIADDYDLIDLKLKTEVTFKSKATGASVWQTKQVKAPTETLAGEIRNETYENPLPDGGDLIVEVKATDKSGASAIKSVQTKVVKVTANVDLSRTAGEPVKDGKIEKNTPFAMTYTVTPKAIPYRDGIDVKDLVIRSFRLNEKLPSNLELVRADVSPILQDAAITGTLADGYRLQGKLADIPYRREGAFFVADPVSFTVKTTPKANGNYLLNDASLSFTDFYVEGATVTKDIARTLQFPSLAIEGVTRMTSLGLTDMVIAKDESSKLIPTIAPADATNKNLTWVSNRPDIVTVDASGVIKGIAEGHAQITASATDGSGLTAVANVTVVIPGLNIVGPSTVNVDDTIDLNAVLVTANEQVASVSWSLGLGQERNADLNAAPGSFHATLTGVNEGYADVTVTVRTTKPNVYAKTYRVAIRQPIRLTLPPEIRIGKGEAWKRDLWAATLGVTPESARDGIQSFTSWTTSDAGVAQIGERNGVAFGVAAGTATIAASYRKNARTDPVAASTRLVVVDLDVPTSITITRGQTYNLKERIAPLPADLGAGILDRLTWSGEPDKTFVSVDATGVVTGLTPGTETISVTYREQDVGPVILSKDIRVNVVDLGLPETKEIPAGLSLPLPALLNVAPGWLAQEVKTNLTWRDEPGNDAVSLAADGTAFGVRPGEERIVAVYRPADGSPAIEGSLIVKVSKVSLTLPPSVTVEVGKQAKLLEKLGIAPGDWKDAIGRQVSWSADGSKAKVEAAGTANGLAPGTGYVKALYTNPLTRTTDAEAETALRVVKLSLPAELTIGQGQTYDLIGDLKIEPAERRQDILSRVTLSDEAGKDFVAVANPDACKSPGSEECGILNGLKPGTEQVTVTYWPADGEAIRKTVAVTVTELNLGPDQTLTLKLQSVYDLYDDLLAKQPAYVKQGLVWSIAGNASEISSAGRLKASALGIAKVKVAFKQSPAGPELASRTFTVRIVYLERPPTGLDLSFGESYDLVNGTKDKGKLSLQPASLPAEVRQEVLDMIRWSDEPGQSIASVDARGVVTAGTKAGQEHITMRLVYSDGQADQFTTVVKVKDSTPPSASGDRY
ncbi:DUF5057 domain-containing protein [Cohnella sp. REN36]|uniref:DUF5057 domain-containing protein n=1 Tax=Cohnella sp. REN36 TaxID=2887347 RepID=UPI001D1405ED|nr:DUF5057 domain-containing protein [Cohnella sp. REN36]MCC3374617.1 DUF5057 domain-containing protein [Cohnella sp. REN36]